MGMYDNIKFEIECPECGEKVDDFQSKDGPCCLYTLDFWDVDNFYSYCPKCKTWIEFTLKNRTKYKLEDYQMIVTKNDE